MNFSWSNFIEYKSKWEKSGSKKRKNVFRKFFVNSTVQRNAATTCGPLNIIQPTDSLDVTVSRTNQALCRSPEQYRNKCRIAHSLAQFVFRFCGTRIENGHLLLQSPPSFGCAESVFQQKYFGWEEKFQHFPVTQRTNVVENTRWFDINASYTRLQCVYICCALTTIQSSIDMMLGQCIRFEWLIVRRFRSVMRCWGTQQSNRFGKHLNKIICSGKVEDIIFVGWTASAVALEGRTAFLYETICKCLQHCRTGYYHWVGIFGEGRNYESNIDTFAPRTTTRQCHSSPPSPRHD